MRISNAALLLALAACAKPGEDKVAAAAPSDQIECAIAGAAAFARDCAVERSNDGKRLVLRNGDGGFHRLDIAPDKTLTAADGADEVRGHRLDDGRTEVAIGSDRYRIAPPAE